MLHGAKERRRGTLDHAGESEERGRSCRQGGEWKDPLTDGGLFATTGVLIVDRRLRGGVGG